MFGDKYRKKILKIYNTAWYQTEYIFKEFRIKIQIKELYTTKMMEFNNNRKT